jgi:hypothetical protein
MCNDRRNSFVIGDDEVRGAMAGALDSSDDVSTYVTNFQMTLSKHLGSSLRVSERQLILKRWRQTRKHKPSSKLQSMPKHKID